MIEMLKDRLSSSPEIEEYEVKSGFKTADGRRYERGDTIRGALREWEEEGLANEAADKKQMIEANTAEVRTHRNWEFNAEPIEAVALVPSEWLHARAGKVLVVPHYGGDN